MTQHPRSGGCTHSDSAPEGVNPDTGWGGRILQWVRGGGTRGWLGERGWRGGSVPFIIGGWGGGGGSQEGSSTGSSLPWEQWVARMAAVAVVVVAVMVMMVVAVTVVTVGTGPSCDYRKLAAANTPGTGTEMRWSCPCQAEAPAASSTAIGTRPPSRTHVPAHPLPAPCPTGPSLIGGGGQGSVRAHRGDPHNRLGTRLRPAPPQSCHGEGAVRERVPWEGRRARLSPAIAPCPQVLRHQEPHAGQNSGDLLTTKGKGGVPRALTPPFPMWPLGQGTWWVPAAEWGGTV